MKRWTVISGSLAETCMLGRTLAEAAQPGLVVALRGELGAGKTTFVRAVAEGLDTPDPRLVTSPTFVLVHEYEGRLPIHHFDAYRLKDPTAFLELGAGEYFEGSGISLVEWADKVESCLPTDRLAVTIESLSPDARRFTAESRGPVSESVLERWVAAVEQTKIADNEASLPVD